MPHHINGLSQDEDKPLKILVAGGGIGGLSAAIALRHAGHIVEIFECSRFATELGAAIHIPPNVNGLLRRFGMIPENHGANQTEYVSEYRPSGERVYLRDVRMMSKVYPYPWQLIHRVDLHNALKDIATGEGRGIPAKLHLRSKVASVDEESLTLEDGSRHAGDLIIGADGVHSRLRSFVAKNVENPEASGTSAFRFLIPVARIKADPKTAHWVERTGELILLYGEDRRIVIYPCRNNTEWNFVAMHPDEETEAKSDTWDQTASKESMLGCFQSYPEDVKNLLSKASDEDMKLWKLLDHDELGRENWTLGRVVLIGDAAHAFLPHQGQGGAQAIEDAAALGALFPLGTKPSDVSRRLELYIKARYDRATMVQDFTRKAAFKTSRGKHGGKVMDPMQFSQVNFTHDAFDHAHGILLRDLNNTALYRRMPLSFGPSPGPRQGLDGRARKPSPAKYKTAYLTFKTYQSYLSTLLPVDTLSFKEPGSWATATFSVTRLENLEWLGGRGYSFFGFYIHGIKSVKASRVPVKASENTVSEAEGDFLTVIFENMADPIITGREELGFSKVFATLDESQKSELEPFSLSAGWEGTEFCKLSLDDLVRKDDAAPVLRVPLLHHKAIASSKQHGKVDAEYTTVSELPLNGDEKRWVAGQASISFTDLEGKDLERAFPTLANIVKGLREVKVVEVISSGIQSSM